MTDVVREFLQSHSDLVQHEDFNELYKLFRYEVRSCYDYMTEFTQLIIDCGGTPWSDLEVLPLYLIREVNGIDSIKITKKTKKIEGKSLCLCPSVKRVEFQIPYPRLPERCFAKDTALEAVTGTHATHLGELCFFGCVNLRSFDALSSARVIEHSAFNSTGLEHIELNEDAVVGECAFGQCSNLRKLNMGAYIVKDNAFQNCNSLSDVTLTSPMTTLGNKVFDGCSQLTEVTFLGTKQEFQDLHKGYMWRGNAPIKTIHCTDGDIRYKR